MNASGFYVSHQNKRMQMSHGTWVLHSFFLSFFLSCCVLCYGQGQCHRWMSQVTYDSVQEFNIRMPQAKNPKKNIVDGFEILVEWPKPNWNIVEGFRFLGLGLTNSEHNGKNPFRYRDQRGSSYGSCKRWKLANRSNWHIKHHISMKSPVPCDPWICYKLGIECIWGAWWLIKPVSCWKSLLGGNKPSPQPPTRTFFLWLYCSQNSRWCRSCLL